MPSADRYAESAIRTVGLRSHTTGYFPHAVMVRLLMQLYIHALYSLICILKILRNVVIIVTIYYYRLFHWSQTTVDSSKMIFKIIITLRKRLI